MTKKLRPFEHELRKKLKGLKLTAAELATAKHVRERDTQIRKEFLHKFPARDKPFIDYFDEKVSLYDQLLKLSIRYGYIIVAEGFDFRQAQKKIRKLPYSWDAFWEFILYGVEQNLEEARRLGRVYFLTMKDVDSFCQQYRKEQKRLERREKKMYGG